MSSYFGNVLRRSQAAWTGTLAARDAVDWNAVVYSLINTGSATSGQTTFTLTNGLVTATVQSLFSTPLAAGSTQYWTLADNASLSMGAGVRLSLITWARLTSIPLSRVLLGKGNFSIAGSHEYGVFYNFPSSRFAFRVSDGTTLTTVSAMQMLGAPALDTWYMLACVYDGTSVWITVNGGNADTAAYTLDIRDGTAPFRVGAASDATSLMNGAVGNTLVYRRALTVNEITQLYGNYGGLPFASLSGSLLTGLAAAYDWNNSAADLSGSGNTLTGVGSPGFASVSRSPTGGKVFFDGNSMTASFTYPSQVAASLGVPWTKITVAVSGQTTSDMITRAPTYIDPYRVAGARQVVAAWEGTNDLKLGATTTAAYNRLASYCAARKALGFKVLILTLLPRNDGGVGFEANRQTVNTSIRSNWPTFANGLVDVALDPTLGPDGSQNNLTYYSDGTHLTPAGDTIIAGYVTPAIQALG